MTVYDFLYYCIDERMLKVEIYDCISGKIVFSGDYDDLPDEILEAELCTFDVPTKPETITLNVEL